MTVIWEFDVAVTTHDLLRRGVTVADYRRVIVLAEDYGEASLAAYAMASGPDGVVVADMLWRY